jgi:hypothetical protein
MIVAMRNRYQPYFLLKKYVVVARAKKKIACPDGNDCNSSPVVAATSGTK